MDLKYKFNASEFAKLLGISTSGVRKRRLSGKLEGQYIKNNSEYFYSAPELDRPIKETFTSKTVHASQSKKRRRGVEDSETKYGNCRNPFQMKRANDYRSYIRIKGLLTKEEIDKVIPKICELAREEVKKDKLKILLDVSAFKIKPVNNLRKIQEIDRRASSHKELGRWFNHSTKEYENNSNKRHIPEYY